MEPTAVLYEGTPGERLRSTTLVVVGAEGQHVVAEAVRLAGEGWSRLELCGGMSVDVAAEVRDAVAAAHPGTIRIGLNRYGFESLAQIADFAAAFERGEVRPQAFLVPAMGGVTRIEHADVTIIPVASTDETEARAAELARAGAGMVELYGGLGTLHAAAVRRGSGGRIPVGFVGYDN